MSSKRVREKNSSMRARRILRLIGGLRECRDVSAPCPLKPAKKKRRRFVHLRPCFRWKGQEDGQRSPSRSISHEKGDSRNDGSCGGDRRRPGILGAFRPRARAAAA